jgi:hypothetical protein
MTPPTPNHRWYHPTPARFFLGLLVVQVFLLLSEPFQWFAFNEKKGWTVLVAVGVVCVAVLVILIWGLVCLCLRWGFQFGVRSLLVLLVAVSVPLGWFAWELNKARRQREAVVRILELGGRVFYDYQDEYGRRLNAEPGSPEWLRKLLGDDFFCEVVTVDCVLRKFGDNDARRLQELTNLKRLLLGHTQITDKGLAHLQGMTKLEELGLGHTKITDDGLAHLTRMANLERLWLIGTHITDEGLAHLRGMIKLDWVLLDDTIVTDEGISQLQQVLPNCDITKFNR